MRDSEPRARDTTRTPIPASIASSIGYADPHGPSRGEGCTEPAATHDPPRFPLRALAQRPPASRSRALGAAQCRHGARGGREVAAAHRGHRRDALPARIRGGDAERLAWPGIAWEEPVRRQSEHLDAYREALARLDAQGLVYPSFESRAEIARLVAEREAKAPWPRDPDGAPLYPGSAKRLSADERAARMASERYALRLDMNAAVARSGALTWVE